MKAKVSLKDNSSWIPKNIIYSKEDLLFYPSNELIEMILQLQSNWNSLRDWLEEQSNSMIPNVGIPDIVFRPIINKMNELEGKNKQ